MWSGLRLFSILQQPIGDLLAEDELVGGVSSGDLEGEVAERGNNATAGNMLALLDKVMQAQENVRETAGRTLVASVTDEVEETASGPGTTERGSEDGVLETGDGHGTEERSLVLGEVGVRALSCNATMIS